MRQTRLGRLYQDGDIIFHKGDQGDCMFLVQKGTLDVILEEDLSYGCIVALSDHELV